ncbi:MAG: type II secretion system secretin GspD [Pseudomonadota bacterium]
MNLKMIKMIVALSIIFSFLFAQDKTDPTEEDIDEISESSSENSPNEQVLDKSIKDDTKKETIKSKKRRVPSFRDRTRTLPKKEKETPTSSSEKETSKKENIPDGTFKKDGQLFVDSFDFNDVDIKDVVKAVSNIVNKNFILDDSVRGKITIVGPQKLRVDEAYRAFLAALEIKGFATVIQGKFIKIIKSREAKQSATNDNYSTWAYADLFMTTLIPIKYISASEIYSVIKGLVSKEGNVISYSPTNTLIVTDSRENIERLNKIISKLDVKGYQERLEIIPVRHAAADEIAEHLIDIFKPDNDENNKKRATSKSKTKKTDDSFEEVGLASIPVSQIIPYERTNSIIVLATETGIEKVKDVIKRLDVPPDNNNLSGKFHVFRLEYAKSEDLATTLTSLVSGTSPSSSSNSSSKRKSAPRAPSGPNNSIAFEGDVNIVSDIPTNSLVITASPNDYRTLTKIINQLDIWRPQVFVESIIMEISLGSGYNIGGVTGNAGLDSVSSFGNFFASTFGGFESGLSDPMTLTGMALGFYSNETATIDLAGSSDITIPVVGAILRAAANSSKVNILSTPHILTTDNTEAEILVGSNVPFVSGTKYDANNNPVIQVSREDVAIKLKITPQVSSRNYVKLNVEEEVVEIIPGQDPSSIQSMGPSTSKRSAKTSVVVKDQQTVVIGGLIGDKITNTVSKIPLLGDIPLLGWLFRNSSNTKTKTNLLLFLTPYVINDTSDLSGVFFKKVQERRQFLNENDIDEREKIKNYYYDVKPLPYFVPEDERERIEEQTNKEDKERQKRIGESLEALEQEENKQLEIQPKLVDPQLNTSDLGKEE